MGSSSSRAWVFTTLLLASLAARMALAEPAPAPAMPVDAAADAKAVLPYLDDTTAGFLRLDIDRIDRDALGTFLTGFFEGVLKRAPIPADVKPMVQAEMAKTVEQSKQWLSDMSDAGGKQLYVLFDLRGKGEGAFEPAMVVPLSKDGDAQKVLELLGRGVTTREKLAEIGGAVVYGAPEWVERVKTRTAPGAAVAERPDLAAALAAAADAPLRMVLVPNDPIRASLEEQMPKLPEPLGGGDVTTLSRGVRWATLAVPQKPDVKLNVTVRASDAKHAKSLMDLLEKGKALTKELTAKLPGAEDNEKQFAGLVPKLTGDTITFTADPDLAQILMLGAEARAEAEVQPAQPGQPAKPDDGGL